MFRKTLITFLLASSTVLRAASPDAPASLRLCHQWAEARAEALKIRREEVVQSRARARAALGSALPRLEWELTDTWQDPEGVEALERQGFGGFAEKEQVESKFTLRQPLFSGFRDFSARSGFKRESVRDALRLERASRELYETTAEAFYAVLAAESEGENTSTALGLARDRVKELTGFKRLGKARDSEVFTAQARAAALHAQLQQIKARIASAREDLSFLTGEDLSGRALTDDIPGPPPVPELKDVLARAGQRSDVRAQREDAAARRLRVRYERGAYGPTADVTGTYYTQRATFLDDIAWDVMASLRVPIFQGGAASARVREASSQLRQSELALEELERRVHHDVRRTRRELVSSVEESRSLEEAAAAAEKSYDALQKEYRLGLVTNLEVLQALDLALAQKTARDSASFRTKLLYVRLKTAMEDNP